jgi:hypothetical protein
MLRVALSRETAESFETKDGRRRETTSRLKRLLKEGSVRCQTEAARLLGVTSQRVHQIVKSDRLDLRFEPPEPVPRPVCNHLR